MGDRPLFYRHDKDFFALASLPHSLLPGVGHNLPEPYIAEWLTSLPANPSATLFEGIKRLPPAHFLRVTAHGLETKRYWNPADVKPIRFARDEEYAEALLELLDRATLARLRSTRPIGSFLSGGLDSSSVTAAAARLLAAKGGRLTAFTAVPRPGFATAADRTGRFSDEGRTAAELAGMYPNIDHVLVDSRGYDLVRTMQRWTDALGDPVPNLINWLWISAIYDQAKDRGIGVMLEGAQGNGAFSYNNWSILRRMLERGRWLNLAHTAYRLDRKGALGLASSMRIAGERLIPQWLTRHRIPAQLRDSFTASLANPAMIERYRIPERILDGFYPKPASLEEEHRALVEGVDSGPTHAAIEAVTGIETRDPTADRRIIEFSFAIPPEQYIVGAQSRSLARRAMKDRLPESMLNNYRRGLQGADWSLSIAEALPALRSELALLEASPAATRALDLPAMRRLLDTWPNSGFETDEVSARWNFWLTRAFTLGYFLRTAENAHAGTETAVSGSLR